MAHEESIEVTPSEDSGNVPAETQEQPVAPSEQPQDPAAPAAKEGEAETPVEPELYELPDGRKVDAATLTKEWKDNFLPDYTRKSQELARINNNNSGNQGNTDINNPSTNPLDDPNWQPTSYAEIVKLAEERALKTIEEREAAKVAQAKAIEDEVSTQLEEVKKLDANLNENALFLHATKYGFRDLRLAHQNMKDMAETVKKVQTTTAQNIQKRNDPVSASPGATGGRPDPSSFSSAQDYLRSLKT